jgi:hypothetical protein
MYIRTLRNTSHILTKGLAYVKANNILESDFLFYQLALGVLSPLI